MPVPSGANPPGSAVTTACQRLQEADQAYHDLCRGALVRSITDENAESVQYTAARRADLLAYIQNLQPQCPSYTATALSAQPNRPPLRFLF